MFPYMSEPYQCWRQRQEDRWGLLAASVAEKQTQGLGRDLTQRTEANS